MKRKTFTDNAAIGISPETAMHQYNRREFLKLLGGVGAGLITEIYE